MKAYLTLAAATAITLTTAPAFAQGSAEQQQSSQRDRVGAIFRALFGEQFGGTSSIDAQWAAGQMPLTRQQSQFQTRVDAEVRSGRFDQTTAARLRSDYAALVQLETQYGADRRFTTQERTELAERYRAVTETFTAGGYANSETTAMAVVADGRAEFGRRVDAAVTARRISRTQGTRLKADYSVAVQLEVGYLRDGVISDSERDDLDSRLDALDVRLGDVNFAAAAITSRSRLDAIGRALPSSGLSAAAQAQLRVQHGDLSRLDAAYAQLSPTADDRAYLDRRLTDLEIRARVRR